MLVGHDRIQRSLPDVSGKHYDRACRSGRYDYSAARERPLRSKQTGLEVDDDPARALALEADNMALTEL